MSTAIVVFMPECLLGSGAGIQEIPRKKPRFGGCTTNRPIGVFGSGALFAPLLTLALGPRPLAVGSLSNWRIEALSRVH